MSPEKHPLISLWVYLSPEGMRRLGPFIGEPIESENKPINCFLSRLSKGGAEMGVGQGIWVSVAAKDSKGHTRIIESEQTLFVKWTYIDFLVYLPAHEGPRTTQ